MDGVDDRVSVVILTHNRLREVQRTLEMLSQLPEQPRIWLVDNGSTDGTAAEVRARFPHVLILELPDNLGSAGRTVGAKQVESPYIAFCDDDTWWEPGSLRRAADLLDEHPRVAVATGRILVGPDEREDPICKVLEQSPLPDEPGLPGYPLLGFMAGASVVRRSAYLEAGGFHPKFMIGGEEELMALDLAARGWLMRYVPEIVVHHYPSTQRDGHRRHWHLVRNALWSAWLRRPLPSALRRTLHEARKARRHRMLLKSFGAALRGLPWVLRERRTVPREVEDRVRMLELAPPKSLTAY
jgi:GT2 family glycosyltransferase